METGWKLDSRGAAHTRRASALGTVLLAIAPSGVMASGMAKVGMAAQGEGNAGGGTCRLEIVTTETTRYRRNAFKVVVHLGGLLGTTRSCRRTFTETVRYEYIGPPLPMGPAVPVDSPIGASVLPAAALLAPLPPEGYLLRMVSGVSPCYGDPIVPEGEQRLEVLRFVALDGRAFDLSFRPLVGRLSDFLGSEFDSSAFAPAYLEQDVWHGAEARVPRSALVAPTLVLTTGGDPDVPILGMLDLSAPDQKLLRVELGSRAAGASLSFVTSGTTPGDGPLAEVDGIALPIVPDSYTDLFDLRHPGPHGTADEEGVALLAFPLVTDRLFEGVDLEVAVLARDRGRGTALAASTLVNIQMRDTSLCR